MGTQATFVGQKFERKLFFGSAYRITFLGS